MVGKIKQVTDIKELGRCKNCAHHDHGSITNVMVCDHPNSDGEGVLFVSPNGFCAWHTPIKCACHICESRKNRVMI